MIKYTNIETKKLRYCKMMGSTTLADLYNFAVTLLDDPRGTLDTLFLTEKSCWESFLYKKEMLEILEGIGKDRIGEKMAVVIKNNKINSTADLSMNNYKGKSLQIRHFPTEEAALSWLKR